MLYVMRFMRRSIKRQCFLYLKILVLVKEIYLKFKNMFEKHSKLKSLLQTSVAKFLLDLQYFTHTDIYQHIHINTYVFVHERYYPNFKNLRTTVKYKSNKTECITFIRVKGRIS